MHPKPTTIASLLLCIIFSVPVVRGESSRCAKRSDHFDGRLFYCEAREHTTGDMFRWWREMETVPWPKWIDDPPQPAPPKRVGPGELRVTYVNQATVLIQMEGLNLLTDPIWSQRASPVSFAGPRRVRLPGVTMDNLPPIDVILISHDHYDHLDLPTLRKLVQRDDPVILVGLGIKRILDSKIRKKVHELDWWENFSLETAGTKVTFVPAIHQSGRGLFGRNRTLWGGYVIEGPAGRIYFAGDTAYGRFLEDIRDKFPDLRLTILPVGNYEKRWFMQNQHMNPDDAVKAHLLLKSHQSVGMHFGTFEEHPEQAIDAHEKDLSTALQKHHVAESEFWIPKFGEGRSLP